MLKQVPDDWLRITRGIPLPFDPLPTVVVHHGVDHKESTISLSLVGVSKYFFVEGTGRHIAISDIERLPIGGLPFNENEYIVVELDWKTFKQYCQPYRQVSYC